MKMPEVMKLGLSRKTIEEIEVDATDLIRHDEFNRPLPSDYRERTIHRLIHEEIPFHSDCNTIFNFVKRFIKVSCPYCKRYMKLNSASGNGDTTTSAFKCDKCGAAANLTMPSKGFSFSPKETP